jgi:hypothetical protein
VRLTLTCVSGLRRPVPAEPARLASRPGRRAASITIGASWMTAREADGCSASMRDRRFGAVPVRPAPGQHQRGLPVQTIEASGRSSRVRVKQRRSVVGAYTSGLTCDGGNRSGEPGKRRRAPPGGRVAPARTVRPWGGRPAPSLCKLNCKVPSYATTSIGFPTPMAYPPQVPVAASAQPNYNICGRV